MTTTNTRPLPWRGHAHGPTRQAGTVLQARVVPRPRQPRTNRVFGVLSSPTRQTVHTSVTATWTVRRKPFPHRTRTIQKTISTTTINGGIANSGV